MCKLLWRCLRKSGRSGNRVYPIWLVLLLNMFSWVAEIATYSNLVCMEVIVIEFNSMANLHLVTVIYPPLTLHYLISKCGHMNRDAFGLRHWANGAEKLPRAHFSRKNEYWVTKVIVMVSLRAHFLKMGAPDFSHVLYIFWTYGFPFTWSISFFFCL